ncbi:MAG: transporter [Chlorobium phaeobacteroides]|jgi:hypothetical protein|nr:transporter [Chlorobium phaeobacteroides]
MKCFLLLFLQLLAGILFLLNPLYAGESGHYVPSSWSCRDLLAAPEGTKALALYGSYYTADKARTADGDLIQGSTGLDLSADSYVFMPVLIYSPGTRILGADWSITLAPQFANTSANAVISAFSLNIPLFDNQGSGIGDTYFIPATLTWRLNEHCSLGAQYSVWIPTGRYEAGSSKNIGLGYWSHDFRLSASFFPQGNPLTLIGLSLVQEINSKKEGYDLIPGNHTSLELGFSKVESQQFIWGVYAGGIWETSNARGDDAAESGEDRVFNAGAEATYWFIPGKLGSMVRLAKEFGARDRFEGTTVTAGVNYIF